MGYHNLGGEGRGRCLRMIRKVRENCGYMVGEERDRERERIRGRNNRFRDNAVLVREILRDLGLVRVFDRESVGMLQGYKK